MAQAVNSPDGVNPLNAVRDVDTRNQATFTSVAEAIAGIPASKRVDGLKIDIKIGDNWKPYYWSSFDNTFKRALSEDFIGIDNNVNNYVLTATGEENTIKGEPELVFDSLNLRIGGEPSGEARLEITHTASVDNLLLIKNTDTNTGVKVNNEGTFQLLEFPTLPTAIAGAIAYSSSFFWVGVE